MTTPIFTAPATGRTEAIEQHVVAPLVAAGMAAGIATAKNRYDVDVIADNVLDGETFEPVVDCETFWRVVEQNDKTCLGAKLRNLADWFRPVDEPDGDAMEVLGLVASALSWEQIDTLGEFICEVRGAAEERGRANFIESMERALAARQDTE